jgi:hypothetical protein
LGGAAQNKYPICRFTLLKFIAGVNDTGDKTVLTIPACLDLKNKQNFNLQV